MITIDIIYIYILIYSQKDDWKKDHRNICEELKISPKRKLKKLKQNNQNKDYTPPRWLKMRT